MHEDIEEKVQETVEAKKGFLVHFGIYCAVIAFLFLLNIITSGPGSLWFQWPALGWGLGVAIHYLGVFGIPGTNELVEKWEIEETAKEMKKAREQRAAMDNALPEASSNEDELELPPLRRRKEELYDDEDFV